MIGILQQMCGMALRSIIGPGPLDYMVVAIGAAAVMLVGILTVVFFIRPGERHAKHIKRRILRDEF